MQFTKYYQIPNITKMWYHVHDLPVSRFVRSVFQIQEIICFTLNTQKQLRRIHLNKITFMTTNIYWL